MTIPRITTVLGLAVSLAACITDLDDDPTVSEQSSALSAVNWSPASYVGNDDQQAYRSGAVATLGGVTYMVHSGATLPFDLWWTQLTSTGWRDDIKIPNQQSNGRVTLAAFNNSLYMLHGGSSDGSTDVWMSRFTPATQTWSTNVKLSYASKGVPAIAAYNGLLYIVGITPSTNQLWMASMNTGEAFTVATLLSAQYSASQVSLAVYQNRLYMAHRAGSTTTVVYNSYNGAWGLDYNILDGSGAPIQAIAPSLAAHDGYLHLVHVRPGASPSYVEWTYFNGSSWPAETTVNLLTSSIDPSLTEGGNGLVMVTTSDLLYGNGALETRQLYTAQYKSPRIIIIFP